jgi:hypothetical protein
MEYFGGLHIGYVKGVRSLFYAWVHSTMSLLCCEDSYYNKEHPDVEAGPAL